MSLTHPTDTASPHDAGPAAAAKPSLLFVDDERAILTALRVVFRNGYDVTVTTDGFEAIELMKTKRFHVVVSDQRMPAITGVQVLTKAREISPNTVRILLTGYSDTDAILGAINDVEVHRFLQKPWENQKVKQVVDEAIRLARSLAGEAQPDDAEPFAETPSERVQRTLAEVVQFPIQPRPRPDAPADDAAPPAAAPPEAAEPGPSLAKTRANTVLLVDPSSELYGETRAEMADKVNVVHAKSIDDVFRALATQPVSVILCSFNLESEADRTFLQILKREYPFILVIAICDTVDATRLIELINQAKIFRYIRRPVSMKILSHYIVSATKLLEQARENRQLLLAQKPDAMPASLAQSAATMQLTQKFESLQTTLWGRLKSWLGLIR